MLHHWQTDDFFASPWRATGEIIRCDRSAGESLDDYHGQEWIQSPYFIEAGGTFYMFYGGHATGMGADGLPAHADDDRNECRMCLMTSPDGVSSPLCGGRLTLNQQVWLCRRPFARSS